MYLDRVALDFPDLKIILSHTGWPWVDEWIALVRKHPNVYGDISSWPPKMLHTLNAQLVGFMDSRLGQEKILFGTNGMGLRMCKEQFMELPISDDAKKKILRENALKVFVSRITLISGLAVSRRLIAVLNHGSPSPWLTLL